MRGFGKRFDVETGSVRDWVVGDDGVKRWADNNEEVTDLPPPLDPPEGCMEIAGFILVLEPGKSWLTADGTPTNQWGERGIWETQEAAEEAKARFCA